MLTQQSHVCVTLALPDCKLLSLLCKWVNSPIFLLVCVIITSCSPVVRWPLLQVVICIMTAIIFTLIITITIVFDVFYSSPWPGCMLHTYSTSRQHLMIGHSHRRHS